MTINITTAPAVPKPKLYTLANVKQYEGIYQHTEYLNLYIVTVVTNGKATSMTINNHEPATLNNTAAQNWNCVDPLWEKLDVILDLRFLPASK